MARYVEGCPPYVDSEIQTWRMATPWEQSIPTWGKRRFVWCELYRGLVLSVCELNDGNFVGCILSCVNTDESSLFRQSERWWPEQSRAIDWCRRTANRLLEDAAKEVDLIICDEDPKACAAWVDFYVQASANVMQLPPIQDTARKLAGVKTN